MINQADLDRRVIQQRAVEMGRKQGYIAEADRLAACAPDDHLESLIDQLNIVSAINLDEAILIDVVAARLWHNWMTVEYNMRQALQRFSQTGGQSHYNIA